MLLKNTLRAVYSCTTHGDVIAIIDHAQGKSATNDAEIPSPISRPVSVSPNIASFNRASCGIWDQLLVDRTGHFAGFSCLNALDLPAALAKLTRH